MQSALGAGAIGKLPGGEVLDACLLAGVVFCALPRRAALDVINVLKGVSEKFFLVLAMGAPPCSVHLRAAFIYTFCETIQRADRLAIVGQIINCPGNDCESHGNPKPNQPWLALGSRGLAFVWVRHSGILIPRHSARRAARQGFRSAP